MDRLERERLKISGGKSPDGPDRTDPDRLVQGVNFGTLKPRQVRKVKTGTGIPPDRTFPTSSTLPDDYTEFRMDDDWKSSPEKSFVQRQNREAKIPYAFLFAP